MPLKLWQHDNGFWYVTGTVTAWRNGQPHSREVRRSTRTRDEAQADGIRRQIDNAEAEQNITGREPVLTFRQAAARYVKNGGEERYIEATVRRLGRLRINEITQQLLDDAARAHYPIAADSTIRRSFHGPVIAVLRANGIKELFSRPPDGEKRTIFFRPEQADRTLKQIGISRYPNPWAGAFATFLFGQGSRVSETLAIDGRDDISLEHRYAILRDTKNGKERMVTLCPRTIAAVSTIPNLGRKGPLFLRYDGRPYDARNGNGYQFSFWKRAVTAVELDPHDFTPHTARHSWATWFYSQTKDVVRLKAEGGWDSSEWERYVKLAAPGLGHAAMQYGFSFSEIPQSGALSTAANTA
jgi:integrase